MIEGEESFQDAANSVMEAAGAIAGQHSDKYMTNVCDKDTTIYKNPPLP